MSSRPLIGITGQTLQAIDDIPASLPRSWVMNRRYFDALVSVGGVPVMVPLLDEDSSTLREIYDRMDGIFLPGGVDVDPATYGHERQECCGATDPPRDVVEVQLARWAIAESKPLFGVCRGLQIINVASGGTLVQDTGDGTAPGIKHDYFPTAGYARDYLAHEVALSPESRLAGIFAASPIRINSMHHQGIDRLGAGLTAAAMAPDGLVEAVERPGEAFVVGVQWHPEMLLQSDDGTRRLFEAFVRAAARFRQVRARGS